MKELHGNADLVAHFFRRAFDLLRDGGAFGLIATNTIGQGDTRTTGLAKIILQGGRIFRATKRYQWPNESAAVVVSIVHVQKRGVPCRPMLDGNLVVRISAYLVAGDFDGAPEQLEENADRVFQGSVLLGMGFTFDDYAAAKGEAEPDPLRRGLRQRASSGYRLAVHHASQRRPFLSQAALLGRTGREFGPVGHFGSLHLRRRGHAGRSLQAEVPGPMRVPQSLADAAPHAG